MWVVSSCTELPVHVSLVIPDSLSNAGNFGIIWSTCEQHVAQSTEWTKIQCSSSNNYVKCTNLCVFPCVIKIKDTDDKRLNL